MSTSVSNSQYYIERPPIEQDCCKIITRSSSLIRIKAPKKMGKTSLLKRILEHGEYNDYYTVLLSFSVVDKSVLTNLEKILQWFCSSVANALGLPDKLEDHWKGMGNKIKCQNYFERYLLTQLTNPLVLGLDDLDSLLDYHEVATEFLGMLQAWHDTGKNDPKWQKLRLIIAHSKEIYIPTNINQPPFNVGVPIELTKFNVSQVEDLIERYGLKPTEELVGSLMNLCEGHPFLTQLALDKISKSIAEDKFLKVSD